MYYEEKVIGGVLFWRGHPHEEFRPYSLEELTDRYVRLQDDLRRALDARQ